MISGVAVWSLTSTATTTQRTSSRNPSFRNVTWTLVQQGQFSLPVYLSEIQSRSPISFLGESEYLT
ncbi:hypothetical protein U0070_007556 [Myodes glareolus]|uniref:Uncharacterized protein n=1 Tax=Myodes glareolus TaxID=447135 RepID=A0AAW0J0W5_MYOGA